MYKSIWKTENYFTSIWKTKNSFTASFSKIFFRQMNCLFCKNICSSTSICPKMFCYEYIFKQFFINILLDFKPKNTVEFFKCCQKRINDLNLFKDVPNPYTILEICLKIFLEEYECFWLLRVAWFILSIKRIGANRIFILHLQFKKRHAFIAL